VEAETGCSQAGDGQEGGRSNHNHCQSSSKHNEARSKHGEVRSRHGKAGSQHENVPACQMSDRWRKEQPATPAPRPFRHHVGGCRAAGGSPVLGVGPRPRP